MRVAKHQSDRAPYYLGQSGLLRYLLSSLVVLVGFACSENSAGGAGGKKTLMVFAAASLRDVADDLGTAYEKAKGTPVFYNFAGSNVLAHQIQAAPRADVFLSADERWVDFLLESGRTLPETRRNFLSNRLVIVGHAEGDYQLASPSALARLDFKHLALADPNAVPAGRYAKAFLKSVAVGDSNLWDAVADRVAPALDVRAALALVGADTKHIGVVYKTDAAISDKVRILYEVPPDENPPITYCAVQVEGRPEDNGGLDFLEFLASPEATAIFLEYGFVTPD